ncbi:MAG: hypothetical protein PVG22_16295 [Chromatiales bacterium]|jgi:hypothetical protein
MSSNFVTKENWVILFRDIGLSDETMELWHRKFEAQYPEGHQEFLEWLNIPSNEIAQIRSL